MLDWIVRLFYAIGKALSSLLMGFMFIVIVLFNMATEKDHLSDELLINNLNTDKAKYETLITMFKQDKPITVVHPTWILPKNAISNERWNVYKRLFNELDLDAGMRSWGGNESIYFISTARGMLDSSSSKGYVYKPQKPEFLFKNLDEFPKNLPKNARAYRKIDNDWYITLD